MDKYDELMGRREKLMEVWLAEFVAPVKAAGILPTRRGLWSPGVRLVGRRGQLAITVMVGGRAVGELEMMAGETEPRAYDERGEVRPVEDVARGALMRAAMAAGIPCN